MQKHEFEQLVGEEVNDSNFEVIQTVYNYHPAISERNGKEEIAKIFLLFNGLLIIKDMMFRAEKCRERELIAEQKRIEYEEAKQELYKWRK